MFCAVDQGLAMHTDFGVDAVDDDIRVILNYLFNEREYTLVVFLIYN